MALRSILAAFSGDPASCGALSFALGLQRSHGAHLTGVVWHGPSAVETRFRAYLTRGVHEMLSSRDAEATAAVRAEFAARVAAEGDPARASFIDLHAVEDFSLPERARGYDLAVMSRRAAELGREMYWARPDVVALRSGRPVITVPDDHVGRGTPRHLLFAWDGKRAAARALGDALHLMVPAERITVLSVTRRETAAPEAGDDVVGLIARHGIAAKRLTRPPARQGTLHTILETADEVGADLLVMGAYEHSKFTEDLLGGVTRDILGRARIPVLMSH